MTRINRYYLNGLIESAREVTPNITILNGGVGTVSGFRICAGLFGAKFGFAC